MKILVPTRGGESSYPNQDKAIEIAKQKGADILFLYITNIEFLEKVSRPVIVDIAQERAGKAGVKAETLVMGPSGGRRWKQSLLRKKSIC